jgi:citronellol/citronellal dehydrogenase
MKRVALVTGSSRGIGANIVKKLAKIGYNVVITGKSTENVNNLGSIYSVENSIKKYNVDSLALYLDIRNVDSIKNCININNINTKGAFYMSKYSIPLMLRNNYGHIINHSPPLKNINNIDIYKNKTAYLISKFGMTMVAMGIASENKNKNIAANTIWPKTAIDTEAVRKNNLGDKMNWRKPDIISDAIEKIILEDPKFFTGNQLIDESFLKSKGVTNFEKYKCVPGSNPIDLDDLFNLSY